MTPWPYPRWIAHRGAGKLAPENTLAAFRLGASHGYRAFECDVKLSADGTPFLLHDSELDRTTSGSGVAGHLAWQALAQLDAGSWHSRRFSGEPIPCLSNIASFIVNNNFALNIEIKPTPGTEDATGQAVATSAAALWAGRATLPLLSSFRPEALAGALAAAPHLPRALLLDTLWPGWAKTAADLQCSAIVTRHALMDDSLVAQLRQAQWRAMVYTVNEATDAQRLLALGVDGLITDAVDRFSPAAL